jgi:hypothetical protein
VYIQEAQEIAPLFFCGRDAMRCACADYNFLRRCEAASPESEVVGVVRLIK